MNKNSPRKKLKSKQQKSVENFEKLLEIMYCTLVNVNQRSKMLYRCKKIHWCFSSATTKNIQ